MRHKRFALVLAATMGIARSHATETSVPFIHADEVHALGIWGKGVTVAVIDSGVSYEENGLGGGIAQGGISIINGVPIPDYGQDPGGAGHGTLVSLIITDPSGVAPRSKVLPVRISADGETFDPGDLVRAINYVKRRRASDPTIRVMNLSAGAGLYACPCDGVDETVARMAAEVQKAFDAGIVVVASTGNEANCEGITAPACIGNVVKVAASYDDNYGWVQYPDLCDDPAAQPHYVACFSNLADYCDYLIAAPGYDIRVGSFQDSSFGWATS